MHQIADRAADLIPQLLFSLLLSPVDIIETPCPGLKFTQQGIFIL